MSVRAQCGCWGGVELLGTDIGRVCVWNPCTLTTSWHTVNLLIPTQTVSQDLRRRRGLVSPLPLPLHHRPRPSSDCGLGITVFYQATSRFQHESACTATM